MRTRTETLGICADGTVVFFPNAGTKEMDVLTELRRGGTLTHRQVDAALNHSRLAARICALREKGWRITTEYIRTRGHSRVGRYVLDPQQTGARVRIAA